MKIIFDHWCTHVSPPRYQRYLAQQGNYWWWWQQLEADDSADDNSFDGLLMVLRILMMMTIALKIRMTLTSYHPWRPPLRSKQQWDPRSKSCKIEIVPKSSFNFLNFSDTVFAVFEWLTLGFYLQSLSERETDIGVSFQMTTTIICFYSCCFSSWFKTNVLIVSLD